MTHFKQLECGRSNAGWLLKARSQGNTISAWFSVSFSLSLSISVCLWLSVSLRLYFHLLLSVSVSLFLGMLVLVSRQHGKNHVGDPVMALAEAPTDNWQHLTGEGPSFQVSSANSLPAFQPSI